MEIWSAQTAPLWLLGGLVLLFALPLLWAPLKQLLRFLLRTAAGVSALALFAPLGHWLGVNLGINLLNGLILGALGLPGLGLLLGLHWLVG